VMATLCFLEPSTENISTTVSGNPSEAWWQFHFFSMAQHLLPANSIHPEVASFFGRGRMDLFIQDPSSKKTWGIEFLRVEDPGTKTSANSIKEHCNRFSTKYRDMAEDNLVVVFSPSSFSESDFRDIKPPENVSLLAYAFSEESPSFQFIDSKDQFQSLSMKRNEPKLWKDGKSEALNLNLFPHFANKPSEIVVQPSQPSIKIWVKYEQFKYKVDILGQDVVDLQEKIRAIPNLNIPKDKPIVLKLNNRKLEIDAELTSIDFSSALKSNSPLQVEVSE
jgi:hypothetical protein